jgi:hypothetical protein
MSSSASTEAVEGESGMEGSAETPNTSSPAGSIRSARKSLRLQLESSLAHAEEGSSPPNAREPARSSDLLIRPRIILPPAGQQQTDTRTEASMSLERSLSTQLRRPAERSDLRRTGSDGLNMRHSLDWSSLFGARVATTSETSSSSQRSTSPTLPVGTVAPASAAPTRPPSGGDQDLGPSDETWWGWGRRR